MSVQKNARTEGGASVEKAVHVKSGWPVLFLTLVLAIVCIASIVVGATMMPPEDAPITTGSQTFGVVLLVVGIVVLCVGPLLLLMGFLYYPTQSGTRAYPVRRLQGYGA